MGVVVPDEVVMQQLRGKNPAKDVVSVLPKGSVSPEARAAETHFSYGSLLRTVWSGAIRRRAAAHRHHENSLHPD